MIRTYSELTTFDSFIDRYRYLKLHGRIGESTFGFDRYLNQRFYASQFWKDIRNEVIARDLGRDLGVEGFEIPGKIIVHHMNPITVDDVLNRSESVFNPEFLICVSHNTHEALHYGDESLLLTSPIIRRPNDTIPWR